MKQTHDAFRDQLSDETIMILENMHIADFDNTDDEYEFYPDYESQEFCFEISQSNSDKYPWQAFFVIYGGSDGRLIEHTAYEFTELADAESWIRDMFTNCQDSESNFETYHVNA